MNRVAILKKIFSSAFNLNTKQMQIQHMLISDKQDIKSGSLKPSDYPNYLVENFSEEEKVAADKIESEWKDVTINDLTPTLLAESIIIFFADKFKGSYISWDDNVIGAEATIESHIKKAREFGAKLIYNDIIRIKNKFGRDIFSKGATINGEEFPPDTEINDMKYVENFSQIEHCYIYFKKFEEVGYYSELTLNINNDYDYLKILFLYEAYEIVQDRRSDFGIFGQKFINDGHFEKAAWHKDVLEMAYIHKILESI